MPESRFIQGLRLACEQTWGQTLAKLLDTEIATMLKLETFGLVRTPIIRDDTRAQIGLVVQWPNGSVTVCDCDADGETAHLRYVRKFGTTRLHTPAEALAWFNTAATEEETPCKP